MHIYGNIVPAPVVIPWATLGGLCLASVEHCEFAMGVRLLFLKF